MAMSGKQHLSNDQKKKLEDLSLRKGGVAFVGKQAMPTPVPTILISLGGLGGETLNVLKRKVEESIGSQEHFYWLAVDSDEVTDLKSIQRSKSEDGYLEDEETMGLFDPSIGGILKGGMVHLPAFAKKWLAPNFPQVQLDGTGAQGTRQIGRLMLTCGSAYLKLRNRLTQMIREADQQRRTISNQMMVNIVIIAGISGGTGSGTIVDVAYLIRDVAERTCNISNYKLSSYIYMPDVQFSVPGISGSPAVKHNLSRNGYAALKEIDYFMNLENHGGEYHLELEGGNGTDVYSQKNIFDCCTIVSGMSEQGGMNGKQVSINNLTENLLDTLTDISLNTDNGKPQLAESFASNLRESLDSFYQSTGVSPTDYPKNANYCYRILGYSSVSIPKAEILAYCVNKMFQAVYAEFISIQHVDGNMVRTVLSQCQVSDVPTLQNYALSQAVQIGLPVDMNITIPPEYYPNKKEIKDGMADYKTYSDASAMVNTEVQKIRSPQFRTQLRSTILNALQQKIDLIFDAHGPYFVVELLTHKVNTRLADNDPRAPFSGILESLDHLGEELQSAANRFIGFESSPQVNAELARLKNEAGGMGPRSRQIGAYVEFVCNVAFQAIFLPQFYNVLREEILRIRNDLSETNNKIWDVYTEILTDVGMVLSRDEEYVTNAKKKGNVFSYQVLNLAEISDHSDHLRAYLDAFVSEHSVEMLGKAFIQSMRDKRQQWTEAVDLSSFDPVSEIRSIFDEVLTGVLHDDIIEKFVVAAYSPSKLTPKDIDDIWANNKTLKTRYLEEAAEQIYLKLMNEAAFMARAVPGYDLSKMLNNKIVATLEDTPELSALIQAKFKKAANVEIATSRGLSKYFYSQLVFCLPLYMIHGLSQYDSEYRMGNDSVGLHMDEVSQNWRRFPQPYCIDYAAGLKEDYKSYDDYKYLMDVKDMTDQGIDKYGFIYLNDARTNYVLSYIAEEPKNPDALEAELERRFHAAYNEQAIEAVSLAEAMKASGYRFTDVDLLIAEHDLSPTDRDGFGRNVQVGDLYKIIRMSMKFTGQISRTLAVWKKTWSLYENAKNERYDQIRFPLLVSSFCNALKAGLIEEDPKTRYVYGYRIGKNVNMLCDIHAQTRFDKDHFLYHIFTSYCALDEADRMYIMQEADETLTGDEDGGLYADTAEEMLGREYLGALRAEEEVTRNVASSRLDYSLTENPRDSQNPYRVLRTFYERLQEGLK